VNITVPQTKDQLAHLDYVECGEYTYGVPAIKRWDGDDTKLKIGKFCSIGEGVKIYLNHGGHYPQRISTYPFDYVVEGRQHLQTEPYNHGDIVIGNDVWICDNVTILSGAVIGDGVILGVGSVVSGYADPYCLYVGNPAKKAKPRFSADRIAKLLKLKWWDWRIETIEANIEGLMGGMI